MKRVSSAVLAALLAVSGSVRAEGPDDRYIEIYKLIQEGDQLAGGGQPDLAKQRYQQAQTDLKRLQASYPNWNRNLIEFRLRSVESKLGLPAPSAAPILESPAPVKAAETPAPVIPAPQPAPAQPASAQPAPTPAPARAPVQIQSFEPVQPIKSVPDDRDRQIQALQEHVQSLEANRSVLEAKLREALAARPAALDPRELNKAEGRIKSLEKEKEVLRVSLQLAEAKATRTDDAGAAEAKKALADARQKLAQQDQTLTAMRQERDVLQRNLQESKQANDEIVKTLRAQNDTLKKQLTERTATPPAVANNDQAEKELATVKSALQSSRDTVASLQVRLRTLEEDRDRLEKTRKDLETKLASAAVAPAPVNNPAPVSTPAPVKAPAVVSTPAPAPAPVVSSADSAQLMRVQQERDDLQKKLNDTVRELAEAKSRTKQPRSQGSSDEVTALRARLESLEARKVPYTPEELALFQKPQELPAVVAKPEEKPSTEPPAAAATLLADAQHAFASRRFDEAEKKYQEALRMDDKNVATLQKLAASQLEQNRPKDAAVTLKRAMDLNPADAHTLLLLGIAEYDQEQYDQALDHLSHSAQADAQNAETQNYLGITLSQKGQRAAAETALRKAIQLSPGYASAHYNLAVVYATQQPPFTELARWHYQKALAFGHPQSADLEKMMERKQATTTTPQK